MKDFIELEELQLPKTNEPCKKEPRLFPTGEMWRDTVRRQLRLQELRLANCEYDCVFARPVWSDADLFGVRPRCSSTLG